MGSMIFRDVPGVSDADGSTLWKHPAGYFSRETTDTVSVVASKYTAGALLAGSGTGTPSYPETCALDFYTDSAGSSVVTTMSLGADGTFKSVENGATAPELVLSSTTGVFKGKVTLSSPRRRVPFAGVLYQKQQFGIGPLGGSPPGFNVLRVQVK